MLRCLLDTNIVIYIAKRRPLELLDTFNSNAGMMAISAITHAEMHHGIEKSQHSDKNRRVYRDFCSRLELLDYGSKAAGHYGDIRATLERAGQTIGVNNLHIAAHARSEGLVLVTNNLREFQRVDGLRTVNWI